MGMGMGTQCRALLHTQDWEPVTNTLHALSLVEKAQPAQVCFTLRLGDQRSMWMHDGCKVHMDSYTASNGSCFMISWIIFRNHLLEVSLTQNREIMAIRTLTTDDLFYLIMCEDPHELKNHWKSIPLRARSHMTSHYTQRVPNHTTRFWWCVGTAFGHFSLGSHNSMVTALGSCVKWPYIHIPLFITFYVNLPIHNNSKPILHCLIWSLLSLAIWNYPML